MTLKPKAKTIIERRQNEKEMAIKILGDVLEKIKSNEMFVYSTTVSFKAHSVVIEFFKE